MEQEEFRPGRPPNNPEEEVRGLIEAIKNTENRIAQYRAEGADTSEFKTHLNNLELRLEQAQRRIKRAA